MDNHWKMAWIRSKVRSLIPAQYKACHYAQTVSKYRLKMLLPISAMGWWWFGRANWLWYGMDRFQDRAIMLISFILGKQKRVRYHLYRKTVSMVGFQARDWSRFNANRELAAPMYPLFVVSVIPPSKSGPSRVRTMPSLCKGPVMAPSLDDPMVSLKF